MSLTLINNYCNMAKDMLKNTVRSNHAFHYKHT